MQFPLSNSDGLSQRSLDAVWHPCTQMKRATLHSPPLPIVRAQGPWLFDPQGRRYFDAISSWWVNLFGHADPQINAALKEQLDTLDHVMLAGCTHEPAVALAEALRARTDGVLGHAFYGSDGASAIEIALKMSFHSWRNQGHAQKREFVCLKHSYHGETLGALSVTDVAIFRDAYDPLLMRAHVVASPDARQAESGQTAIDVANHALQSLRTVFDQRAEKIAAVLIEPLVQCAAGMAMHDPHYLRGVRALCDEFDVHLIADEIAVGCGRTGTFFAFEQAQIGNINTWPDFLTLSKGITGGYLPLSIVLTRDEIYRSFWDDQTARGFLHSHSYTGNPLACRAAQTVLAKFSQNDVLNQNMQRTAPLRTLWHELTNDPRIQHARCQGMIFAFDVASKFVGDNFSERFHQTGLKNELLIRPIGNTVYVMPSYLLAPQDYDWLGQQVVKTLDGVVS